MKDSTEEPSNMPKSMVVARLVGVSRSSCVFSHFEKKIVICKKTCSDVRIEMQDLGCDFVVSVVEPGFCEARVIKKIEENMHYFNSVQDKEITLRCGKASITLTKAGKIILRGTYISSRSSGMNRIKGGSVQLN